MTFTLDELLAATVVVTALRVFAPDARHLTRRLLRAGVRVGAAELLKGKRPSDTVELPAPSDEGAR
ncbi:MULTISPECIES: hypothetical protein [unclassified Streptomyces]|uniref:hypothetical protein n=1 Tax=unclassified Streptomyces TaxID=2593676 RepID=UPI00352CBB35|nr:hypothetical protein OG302_32560 [Streptomyces sp. NBC_01283]